MADRISITVKCFSHVRHALDCDQLTIELPAPAFARDAEAAVRERAGGALDGLPLRIAVNQAFTDGATALATGDEVALIPPVQGG